MRTDNEPAAEAAFLASIRRNAVALISLTVALAGLSYNTWRNETTERHRNVRQGAFVMLEQLGQLQQLVDQRFYAEKRDDVNLIGCWGKVTLLRDMSPLVSKETASRSSALFEAWRSHLPALDQGDAAAEAAIAKAIAANRDQLVVELSALR